MALWTLSKFRAVASKICTAAPDSATSFVACGSMSTVNETLQLDKWHLLWMYSAHTHTHTHTHTRARARCVYNTSARQQWQTWRRCERLRLYPTELKIWQSWNNWKRQEQTKVCMHEPVKSGLNSGNACCRVASALCLPVCYLKTIQFNTTPYISAIFAWYGCETWYLAMREERRLRVFENKVLRKIFGYKMIEATGYWRKLQNEELPYLYWSPHITKVITRRIR